MDLSLWIPGIENPRIDEATEPKRKYVTRGVYLTRLICECNFKTLCDGLAKLCNRVAFCALCEDRLLTK
jgi:hypothetical protein